ncbi:hypothetical protein E2562_002095 [Oryza meyeriana var. granulata]|uniref:Uncharacterized protein n=1 Tax=Oryza meyeriana var. granulata TaxID=110450 RepID=A0A6G1ECK3_9ORYZ|nr:hypothetical protein E2562_002095 [Oryza meyeriana var. granulata]
MSLHPNQSPISSLPGTLIPNRFAGMDQLGKRGLQQEKRSRKPKSSSRQTTSVLAAAAALAAPAPAVATPAAAAPATTAPTGCIHRVGS